MLIGAHTIIYSKQAEEVRAFLRDVLELDSIDIGGGWLIFALPPAELAVHPDEGATRHELYLMCEDIETTVQRLKAKGVELAQPVTDQRWGLVTAIRLPDGSELGVYQPKHATAFKAT
jgi:uncharacterized glyoxalase superfamily protein PhnB